MILFLGGVLTGIFLTILVIGLLRLVRERYRPFRYYRNGH